MVEETKHDTKMAASVLLSTRKFPSRTSGTLERHLAVGSGFGGRQMPLNDAGYRRTTLDAVMGWGVQVPLRH